MEDLGGADWRSLRAFDILFFWVEVALDDGVVLADLAAGVRRGVEVLRVVVVDLAAGVRRDGVEGRPGESGSEPMLRLVVTIVQIDPGTEDIKFACTLLSTPLVDLNAEMR